jgi:hypothetical protein
MLIVINVARQFLIVTETANLIGAIQSAIFHLPTIATITIVYI